MQKRLFYFFMLSLAFTVIIACSDDDDEVPAKIDTTEELSSCEMCHSDYELLKAVHTPDTGEVAGGCSGDVIVIEPYDRVYLGGEGYQKFKQSKHYKLGCTYCHNGVEDTDDKNEAHSGDFISAPSHDALEKCAECHPTKAHNALTSIHVNGWGQKRKVTTRYGLAGSHEFDQLPEDLKHGYDFNCARCHGSCGECHINRPPAGGGGLIDGHNFVKEPDMVKTCVTCHTSRGGHAYLGTGPGTKIDIHLEKAKFTCTSCHGTEEVHGDGNKYETRYHDPNLPKCINCHTDIEKANNYHSMHYDDLNCYVCHSQPYNNCGSCHIHGDGARVPSYMDYKIGVNPIQDVKPGKMVLVRRSLMAPDSWEKYGESDLANFNAHPIYNYTSPHNIRLRTAQCTPADGKPCYDACHIIKEADTLRNKDLYLFKSDFDNEWELQSTEHVAVDDKLPDSWGIK